MNTKLLVMLYSCLTTPVSFVFTESGDIQVHHVIVIFLLLRLFHSSLQVFQGEWCMSAVCRIIVYVKSWVVYVRVHDLFIFTINAQSMQ